MNNTDNKTCEWLMDNAGPIIRWRIVKDFGYPVSKSEASRLREAVLKTEEVKRWLGNLGRAIHGSKDTDAENAMSKLVEYGLHAGIPEFDEKAKPYAEREHRQIDCFLIAAGYNKHKGIKSRFQKRLSGLQNTAKKRSYDFYLTPKEAESVPKAWRDKLIYRSDNNRPLPSCYDLYAMAHWNHGTEDERNKISDIIKYVSGPEFQSTPGGYIWDRKKNRCYSAGRVCLACLNPERLVLFTELFARFKETHDCDWFKDALGKLESCRTERGTYIFPTDYLKEKRNSYYIYQGAHMGLGENRRQRNWCELESTFRMLNIKRLMKSGGTPKDLS